MDYHCLPLAKPPSFIKVVVTIHGQPFSMTVDTGAAVSLVSEGCNSPFSTAILRTYTGQTLDVVGELLVNVQYRQQSPKN